MRENEEPVTENLLVIHGLLRGCNSSEINLVVLTSPAKCLITEVSCLTLKNIPMRTNEIISTTNLYLSADCFLKMKKRSGVKLPRSATKHARVFVSQNVVYIIADNTKNTHKI